MIIRIAAKHDLSSVSIIFRENLSNPPYNYFLESRESYEIIERYFRTQVMYVAQDDVSIVGFVVGDKYFWIGGWHLWIAELFVDTKNQRKEIGTNLISAIENHFKKDHIVYVELLAHNEADAKEFYKKNAFIKTPYIKLEKRL